MTVKPKLLALCDSPQLQTGFARVSSNLLSRWHDSGFFAGGIHVWGIGHGGWPTPDLPYQMWPAAQNGQPIWWHPDNLQRFVDLANRAREGYTHVWMMHDIHSLRPLAEPMFTMKKTLACPRTFGYFPVDAPLDHRWIETVEACDHPVAYTQYGIDEMVTAFRRKLTTAGLAEASPGFAMALGMFTDRLSHLPHGVDGAVYYPIGEEARRAARQERFGGQVAETDFLIVNVNAHQRRKGLYQSLEILAHLRRMEPAVNWRLYLHMPRENPSERTDLGIQAEGLGLPADAVLYGDAFYASAAQAIAPEATLREIYNCADLFLTTTHGEGWGLTVCEAMACGVPVAAPFHTALREILDWDVAVELPIAEHVIQPGDNNRPRPVVDSEESARLLSAQKTLMDFGQIAERGRQLMLAPRYDWDVIARQWLDLFEKVAPRV